MWLHPPGVSRCCVPPARPPRPPRRLRPQEEGPPDTSLGLKATAPPKSNSPCCGRSGPRERVGWEGVVKKKSPTHQPGQVEKGDGDSERPGSAGAHCGALKGPERTRRCGSQREFRLWARMLPERSWRGPSRRRPSLEVLEEEARRLQALFPGALAHGLPRRREPSLYTRLPRRRVLQ